jgi:hypothetical protein
VEALSKTTKNRNLNLNLDLVPTTGGCGDTPVLYLEAAHGIRDWRDQGSELDQKPNAEQVDYDLLSSRGTKVVIDTDHYGMMITNEGGSADQVADAIVKFMQSL